MIKGDHQFWHTLFKKVTNKSMSKLDVKGMRDTDTLDLSCDTPRPKFDLILWPGWVNPSHKFDHN